MACKRFRKRITITPLLLLVLTGFACGARGQESPASAEDTRDAASISRSGRSLGGGNGNPLQHSYLENLIDREAWRVTESDTTEQLSIHVLLVVLLVILRTHQCLLAHDLLRLQQNTHPDSNTHAHGRVFQMLKMCPCI